MYLGRIQRIFFTSLKNFKEIGSVELAQILILRFKQVMKLTYERIR